MNAEQAVDLLKQSAIKPSSDFQHNLEKRFSIANLKEVSEGMLMFVDQEEVLMNGKPRMIRRLFLQPRNADSTSNSFSCVGWVVNEDINSCMVCGIEFGMFRWPHHCRSCGNIVCHPCSPETATVVELQDLGEVRVCVLCYWGQDPVHASYTRELPETNNMINHDELISRLEEPIDPVPVFAVLLQRRLSFTDTGRRSMQNPRAFRLVFINVCIHDILLEWPEGREFVVCNDVRTVPVSSLDLSSNEDNESSHYHGEEDCDETAEIYHVVVRSDLLGEDSLVVDNEQVMEVPLLCI